jgi:hypothetical protein
LFQLIRRSVDAQVVLLETTRSAPPTFFTQP